MAYCVNGCWTVSNRIGIGTETPSTALHIVGAHTSGLGIINAISSDSSILNLDSATADARVRLKYQGGERWFAGMSDTGFAYHIQNGNNGCIALAVSYATGYVGVGTCNPQARLEVNGTSRFINCALGSHIFGNPNVSDDGTVIIGTVVGGTALSLTDGNAAHTYFKFNAACGSIIQSDSRLTFITTGACNALVLTGGNAGIGTSSPAAKLHLCGSGDNIFRGESTNTGTVASYYITNVGATAKRYYAGVNVAAADGGYAISDSTCTDAVRFYIKSEGSIGIATISPTYKLHVNGTFYAAGSSQDYKQSICNYNTDSCMFMKLKPVTYQYKEEYCHLGKELKSGTQIGLIAEEVAETYPELAILVNEDDQKIVRNVDYEKLSIVLLSEVQKLRKELDELKTK